MPLLSLASAFFDRMFSLPLPNGADINGDVMKDELHVVPMQEHAQTLEYILRLCHPSSSSNPSILELEVFNAVFYVAKK